MKWDLARFDGKDVVFIGLGKGRAAQGIHDFLVTFANIKSFIGIDKPTEGTWGDVLAHYDQATTVFVKNEGVPGTEITLPYSTQLQLFFELLPSTGATTIGITGTKGKSTTASLTAHILQAAGKKVVLAGNIGVSPLLSLANADKDTIFVLELSSYQLADLTVSPHVSACINLYNDHVDFHGTQANYWEAKHNIMRYAGPNDVFIYNPDFPALQAWAVDAICTTITINPSEVLSLEGARIYGEHNRLNALMARDIARQFDVNDTISQQAIISFEPLEHRMQLVDIKHGVIYIDDAIGMTPESTIASLEAVTDKYGQVSCLLLGGKDRDYDFTALMKAIAGYKIPHLVMFPNTVEKMKAALPANYAPEIFETSSMTDAVTYATEHSVQNNVVLLSTAAPSYLLWKDFEDKGDQFQAAVRAIA